MPLKVLKQGIQGYMKTNTLKSNGYISNTLGVFFKNKNTIKNTYVLIITLKTFLELYRQTSFP